MWYIHSAQLYHYYLQVSQASLHEEGSIYYNQAQIIITSDPGVPTDSLCYASTRSV